MQDNSQPIKAVFFDLGYTLIFFSGDFYKVILESYLVLADELIKQGCQIDRIEFACEFSQKMQNYYQQREQDFLERPVGQIVTEILKEHHQELPSENTLTLAMQAMYLITEKNWLLEDDTHETLQTLLDQNYQLGLISNASNAWDVNNLIDNHHLRNYFSTILISASEGIRKPNPKIFQIAADQMHIQLSNAVMVGDTLEADILGAHNAGMRGIWISRRKERPSPQAALDPRYLPDAEIHTLKELPALLSSWNK